MQSKQFDAIDKLIEKKPTVRTAAAKKTDVVSSEATGKAKIKALWVIIKPILEVAKSLLFFKPKWVVIISDFILAVDAVYK